MMQVLVVNQFDTVVGGFVAVTSKWARLYFTFFYLLGVLLILNIVIAVMLDSFITSMHHQTVLATNQARQSHVDSKEGGGGGDDSAVDSNSNNCSGGGDVEGGGHDQGHSESRVVRYVDPVPDFPVFRRRSGPDPGVIPGISANMRIKLRTEGGAP
mmetsp:Transcript_66997/g.131395  ORF Transcript_66997/g.131395 Transcript_66997/m.131395 type:complete len:156 (-) Transcript_66997:6-473(-)